VKEEEILLVLQSIILFTVHLFYILLTFESFLQALRKRGW